MQRKNKPFLILTTCIFFILLGWKWVINGIFFLQIDFLLRPFGYYERELAYNTLLSKRGADGASLALLREYAPLGREADRAELLGDTLSLGSGSQRETISWYEQSLVLEERSRVREKILLLQPHASSGGKERETLPPEKSIKEGTGTSEAIKKSEQRIQEDRKNQTKYLEKPGQKYTIQDTIEFLNLDEERVDW